MTQVAQERLAWLCFLTFFTITQLGIYNISQMFPILYTSCQWQLIMRHMFAVQMWSAQLGAVIVRSVQLVML